ncbi:MAG: response regulator [Chloroflexi bacterium]|nr:response regulator [Chloroflexota bacterium]
MRTAVTVALRAVHSHRRPWHRPANGNRSAQGPRSPQVLVIEEDRDVLELIGLTLRRAGLHPVLLTHESLALSHLSTTRPDAVVLGLPVGHRQPAQLLRRLRRRHPRLPVVILSPEAPSDSKLVHVLKPFSPRMLADQVLAGLGAPACAGAAPGAP